MKLRLKDRAQEMRVNEKKNEAFWKFNYEGFCKNVEGYCLAGLTQFKKIVRSYVFLHLFFIGLFVGEMLLLFVSCAFFFHTSLFALSLAILVLTAFAYLIVFFYAQVKKPEQFFELQKFFMRLCKKGLAKNLINSDYHLSLANAAYRFAARLKKEELQLYFFSPKMSALNQMMKKVANFCHKKDIERMRESLFLTSINEHIQLIKIAPTHLEAHASLANAYVALSRLYQTQEGAQEKFKATAKKAIQEYKVINHLCPNDPWVYAQLASCYHDLREYVNEIAAYEKVLRLCPEDKQILFRLGVLCFQQGQTGRALQIYQKLKEMRFSRADELIDFYDVTFKDAPFISSF